VCVRCNVVAVVVLNQKEENRTQIWIERVNPIKIKTHSLNSTPLNIPVYFLIA
jgi:hypothetical protein